LIYLIRRILQLSTIYEPIQEDLVKVKDRLASATALYVALCLISHLKTMLYPFLPFSSEKLHELLGFKGNIEDYGWELHSPPPGQKLLPPEPLFSKLDEELIEEETGRLGQVNY